MRTKWSSDRWSKLVGLVTLGFAVLISVSFISTARAQTPGPCRPQGAVRGCSANGKPGQQVCDGAVWGYCKPNPPPPPPPVTGTVTLNYYVLTVIYAPPGTNGGKSSSSVDYGASSTVGSTVSAVNSFKQGYTVGVTASQGILGTEKDQLGVSFGYTNSSSSGQSLDIKKSDASDLSDVGPATDGVNHDHDLIYLWLSPTIQVRISPTASGGVSAVAWQPLNNSGEITYVYAGWLRNPSTMIPQMRDLLQRHGITAKDFPEILKADPFANLSLVSSLRPPRPPDPLRFKLYGNFPYEPPLTPADPVPTEKHVITFTSTQTTTTSAQNEYTVGLTVQASGSFPGLFDLTIKDTANWTWTSTDTNSNSSGATQSATLVIGGPAFGYKDPSLSMAVYYDVIYKTFLFVPVPTTSQPTFTGSVAMSAGQPVGSGREVVVVANGVTYHTFTNAKGQYRVFTDISGPFRVQIGTVTKEVPQLPATRRVDLVLPR